MGVDPPPGKWGLFSEGLRADIAGTVIVVIGKAGMDYHLHWTATGAAVLTTKKASHAFRKARDFQTKIRRKIKALVRHKCASED
jgi:hypothetical protein